MRKTFAAISIVSGLAVVALAVALAVWGNPDPGPRGARGPSALLYVGLGGALTISLTALALLGWSNSVVRRMEIVAATNPTAFVFVAQKTAATEAELRVLSRGASSLPSLLILGLGEGEIGVWGRDARRPVAVIPRAQVKGAGVVTVYNGRSLPAIELELDRGDGVSGSLTFVPCRPNWEIWPNLDSRQALQLAAKFSRFAI